MSEIEKMKRYIRETKLPRPRSYYYEMGLAELDECLKFGALTDVIFLAFLYGRAKGYRCAKAEARK